MPSAINPTLGAQPIAVLRQFRLVFNAVKTHFQQVEKRAGIGGAQLWALSVIQSNPGVGLGQLATEMEIHQTTASNLVKGLTTLGLIASKRDDTDRRAIQLHILSKGKLVLKRAPGPFTGVLPEALSRLDPKTLKRLSADLDKLIEIIDADKSYALRPLGEK